MSQLPVIYQFWKQGFRPETEEDWKRLEMVLNGDENLELAERYFVFKKDVPDEDRYFRDSGGEFYRDGEGNRVINYNNAFRIKMTKKFEVGKSEDVESVREEVKGEVGGV